jgi:carbon storage regulator
MLVLSRKLNQAIMIGDDVRVVIVSVDRDQVKLGIEAPREVPVHRSEVYEEIRKSHKAGASGSNGTGDQASATIRGSGESAGEEPSGSLKKPKPKS